MKLCMIFVKQFAQVDFFFEKYLYAQKPIAKRKSHVWLNKQKARRRTNKKKINIKKLDAA